MSIYEYYCKSYKVSTDSRKIEPDAVFFALKGERFDGNDFAVEVAEKGVASLVVADRPSLPDHPRILKVKDSLQALQELAHYHRCQMNGLKALSLLIGQSGQTIARGSFANQSLPTELATGVGIQLLNNRADVHYAEMSLAQCFYDVETARSRFYPNITVTGTAAFTNNNGLVNPSKLLLQAVGSLVQPIFQHGQIVAGLKVAKAKYEQAFNNWQNAIYKAGNEVSNALVSYNSYSEKSVLDGKRPCVV